MIYRTITFRFTDEGVLYLAYHPEKVTWRRRERGRGRLKTGELPGKRGKRQCSITTQPNGSTITAPILPAQLNYCVERPREISGIDIESVAVAARPASWREFGWMTRMRTRLTEGKKKGKKEREFFYENESLVTKARIFNNNSL